MQETAFPVQSVLKLRVRVLDFGVHPAKDLSQPSFSIAVFHNTFQNKNSREDATGLVAVRAEELGADSH
eukprot:508451-Rhodomonas_salina.2